MPDTISKLSLKTREIIDRLSHNKPKIVKDLLTAKVENIQGSKYRAGIQDDMSAESIAMILMVVESTLEREESNCNDGGSDVSSCD